MNPARSLAPALVSFTWTAQWILQVIPQGPLSPRSRVIRVIKKRERNLWFSNGSVS
jgi:hypothetical protein